MDILDILWTFLLTLVFYLVYLLGLSNGRYSERRKYIADCDELETTPSKIEHQYRSLLHHIRLIALHPESSSASIYSEVDELLNSATKRQVLAKNYTDEDITQH